MRLDVPTNRKVFRRQQKSQLSGNQKTILARDWRLILSDERTAC
jgi:hypothetical protein